MKTSTESAIEFTRHVTTKWPDRLTGRSACLACADYLKSEFEKFSDRSTIESFDVHPGAFLGYMKVNVVLYFICIGLLWKGFLIMAMGVAILSMIITLSEFMFYKEFVDPLYKKRTGKNVYGIIEPNEEVKQQIIVSAHHDSAHIFNFLEKRAKWYPLRILSGILFQVLLLVLAVILGIAAIMGFELVGLLHFTLVVLCLGIPFIGQLWFFIQDKGTPGAGDNMICVAVAMEIGKAMAKDKSLKHTRLIIASWDSEECGLRGARAYVKRHRSELQSTKTYNYNLESLYDHESLAFLTSDLNGLVPLSTDMVEECIQIADNLGYETKAKPFPMLAGGTDAAEMAKAGVEATCLAGMSMEGYGDNPAYHTTRDTIDAVDPKAVEAAIEIGIAYIRKKDDTVASSIE